MLYALAVTMLTVKRWVDREGRNGDGEGGGGKAVGKGKGDPNGKNMKAPMVYWGEAAAATA